MNFLTTELKIKELEKEIENFDNYLAMWQIRYYQMLGKLTECQNENQKLKEKIMYDNDRRTGTDYEYEMHLDKVVCSLIKNTKKNYSNVKFISTTNERYKYFEGKIGGLEVKEVAWFNGKNKEDVLRTSHILGKKINDNILEIKTRNSIYKFEILS